HVAHRALGRPAPAECSPTFVTANRQAPPDGRAAVEIIAGVRGPGWGRGERAMLTPVELVWLLAAVAKGDEAAFERLYAATRAKLYGVVLRILRRHDLADEVMQEAYLKIWNGAGRFGPALSAPITWMVA